MTSASVEVTREQVLAYRVAAQGLDRTGPPDDPAVLDLGVQDTPSGSARLALAARTTAPVPSGSDEWALVWSTRGAPHLHRRADLPRLARALWPLSDADATARYTSSAIREGGRLGLAGFTAAARAMYDTVLAPTPRGEVSTRVSALVPESLTFWCRTCEARHISGALFQQVGLAAGVELDVSGRGTVLRPWPDRPAVPTGPEGAGTVPLTYLRLLGPATPAETARFLGTTQTAARPAWPAGDLVEVRVAGRRAWLPQDRVEALLSAPEPRLVRLLPPSDPFLQARDRDLLLPDRARQSQVWRVIAAPGALLVDGEVRGTWKARMAGRSRLEVTVTPFGTLPARVRDEMAGEAGRVAEARGVSDLRLVVTEAG